MRHFKEIEPGDFPEVDKSKYPDYWIPGCEDRIDRLFKYKDCYVEVFVEDDIAHCAIINFGKAFSINVCVELMSVLLKDYDAICFSWVPGIKNEILIKRIVRDCLILEEGEEDGCRYIKFTKEEKWEEE